MKIAVRDTQAVIVDNAPLVVDVREKNYIDVELPDDKAYFFGFHGTVSERREVINGKVELPQTFFTEQTIQVVVYRADGNGLTAIPCEPIKTYRVGNKEMFLMRIENAIGQGDVRDKAESAMAQCYAMAEALTSALQKVSELENEVKATKNDLANFHKRYDENVAKINDVIQRVENMEADYDILTK